MPDIWMDVDAAVVVPVNVMPLLDDTDFKTRETAIAYNAAGMDLVWNFVTTAGAVSQTALTPTTGSNHDWTHTGDGLYSMEIPASGGTINNDTEGVGWFSGICTGVLAWRGPTVGFRAAGLNNVLVDNAYSATRGLSGTALPDAAAEASGGLPTLSAAQASNGTIQANVHRWLTGTPNALQSGRVDGYLGAVASGVIAAASFAAGALDAVWAALTSGMSTAGSIGKKLKDWVLGSDNYVLVSSDLHSTGMSAYEVTNNVGGRVVGGTSTTFLGAGVQSELTSSERNSVADALLDRANGVETGLTPRQALRLVAAILGMECTVVDNLDGTFTSNFKRLDGVTTAHSVDDDGTGNRTNATLGTLT